jgi:DNA gyrase/topoisomerase IV subunit B
MDKKDIVRYMATTVANLNTKGKFTNTYYRILGGLEGMLICIGKIPLEGKLP